MKTRVMLAVLSLGVAACATGPDVRDAERLALYSAHAGEPVSSFQYFGRISGWTPLGDSALVLRSRPNQAYLLDLTGHCPGLEFARAITVSNQFGRVHARFDSVHVVDRDAFDIPCRIDQIRPVDLSALRETEREMRDSVEVSERAQESGGT